MKSPSPLAFWRGLLGLSLGLALLSLWEVLNLARRLNVAPLESKSILALLALCGLTALGAALGLGLGFRGWPQRVEEVSRPWRWLAGAALLPALAVFPWLSSQPAFLTFSSGGVFLRFLVFWALGLGCALLLRLAWPRLEASEAWAAAFLLQAALNLLAANLPALTDFPFALGWSETSRFYFPSLFLSEKIYGQKYPWPILHPSLHLLLTPPYWFNAPLWAHRAWQVFLRVTMTALIPPALLSRFGLKKDLQTWLLGLGIFVFLTDVSIYLHLPLMVFPLLWLYHPGKQRRTWLLLLAASVWAGLSRINWYPMPGLLLACLWLEEEAPSRPGLRGLLFPAALTVIGALTAFLSARAYIALSGVEQSNFFTSLTSDLLWYRLWPNPTYPLGVIPAISLLSAPLWLVLWWGKRPAWPQIVLLAGLLAGGLLVSLKIGGGADVHNLDAYAVMLIVVAAYAFFRRSQPLPWPVLGLLILLPAWFAQIPSSGLTRYDPQSARQTLTALQRQVDSTPGEILFITQRQLLSMRLLTGVTLLPEYEREDLMEMAMAHNTPYLERFERDVQAQRFALIVVDPLKFNLLGSAYPMGEENNAWARWVVRPVLCWYEEAERFPQERIVIYRPRPGGKACP